MILKVKRPETGAWVYLDKIQRATVHREVRKNMPLVEGDLVFLSADRDLDVPVVICSLIFEDGPTMRIIFNLEGYLLNDSGQTIESL